MNDMHTHDEDEMKDAILGKIRGGQLKMRPRIYFTLQVVLLALLALAVLVLSIFIVNFLVFSIRINSHDALLGFGPRGIVAFLIFFPWTLLAIDAGLIIVLELLLRRFRFAYRRPAIYLLFALFAGSLFLGVFLDRGTRFNDVLSRRPAPPFLDIYGSARQMPPLGSGLCTCTITEIAGNTLIVTDKESSTTLRIILPMNDARATTSMLRVGDTIFVGGDMDESGAIRAFGIRRIPPQDGAYPLPR